MNVDPGLFRAELQAVADAAAQVVAAVESARRQLDNAEAAEVAEPDVESEPEPAPEPEPEP